MGKWLPVEDESRAKHKRGVPSAREGKEGTLTTEWTAGRRVLAVGGAHRGPHWGPEELLLQRWVPATLEERTRGQVKLQLEPFTVHCQILSKFSYTYLVSMYKAMLYAGHHTLCPWQPGCLELTSVNSVAESCPPYLYLGLRGRASLPDVHRKQGWGWAGQGGEENGGLRREVAQDRRSSLLFLSGAPNTRFGICRKGNWNCLGI